MAERKAKTVRSLQYALACKWFAELCAARKFRIAIDHYPNQKLDDDIVIYSPVTRQAPDGTQVYMHCFEPYDRFKSIMAMKMAAFENSRKLATWAYTENNVPRYSCDNSALAFRNGVFFLETGEFRPHDDCSESLVCRTFLDFEFGSTDTPVFDTVIDPADCAAIGRAIRGTTNHKLFIIGDSYDDRRPLRHVLFDTFHPSDTTLFTHECLLRLVAGAPDNRPPYGHTAYIGFEDKVVTDAMLNLITVANGTSPPRFYNKDRVDLVFCKPGTFLLPIDFVPETPAIIKKSVLASLGGPGAPLHPASTPEQGRALT